MAPAPTKLSTDTYKRIVVCCDGTWQSSVSEERNIPSNVTRLCRHLARSEVDQNGRIAQQVVYYDSGVGTGALSWFEARRQGGVGDGLSINVLEAYTFIALNYRPGDSIYCFGFSRGAYTARAIAGLITDIGICEPRSLDNLPDVYRLYKANYRGNPAYKDAGGPFREFGQWKKYMKEKREEAELQAKEDNEEARDNPALAEVLQDAPAPKTDWDTNPEGGIWGYKGSDRVKVVGVWDTVGALGIPDTAHLSMGFGRKEYSFHNVRLSPRKLLYRYYRWLLSCSR